MSENFGQRQTITRDSVKSIQKTIQAAPDGADEGLGGGGFSLPKPVKGLLMGFGVIAALLGSHVAMMNGFGRVLDQHWGNAGLPSIESTYQRSTSGINDKLLEKVHNDCKTRSDFVTRTMDRSIAYLTCVAGEQPKRFCDRRHRQHLFAAVRDYYDLKAKVREEQMFANAGPFVANRNALIGGSERESFATTSQLSQDTDPRVISSLKFLISGGYVSRLGVFEATRDWRTDLDVALRGIEPKQKGCA